jgi:DNA-binding CsgD family transcriptional regulator
MDPRIHRIEERPVANPYLGAPPRNVRAADPPETELLRLALNQVDYGLVVLDADSAMLHFANGPGHAALADGPGSTEGSGRPRSGTGLCLVQGRVATVRPGHHEQLRSTLARTRAGLRGLLSLGADAQSSAVAVLPLPHSRHDGDRVVNGVPHTEPQYALLVFAKQQLCDDSTVALFARERGLTGAEAQVLTQICKGLRPTQIATRHGVQISTVRTQLRSIRMKTHCQTIRELVQKVSVLPPMARHLSGHLAG